MGGTRRSNRSNRLASRGAHREHRPKIFEVADGVLYAPSFSGFVYAIDASNGSVLWNFNIGGSVIDGPSIVNGTVFWG